MRARYAGEVRNPWNEYECGNYYARAMSSYGLLLALGGFRYHAPARRLELAPRLAHKKGRLFFAVESGWGSIHYSKQRQTLSVRIEVEEGELSVDEIAFSGALVGRKKRQKPGQTARPGRPLKIVFDR